MRVSQLTTKDTNEHEGILGGISLCDFVSFVVESLCGGEPLWWKRTSVANIRHQRRRVICQSPLTSLSRLSFAPWLRIVSAISKATAKAPRPSSSETSGFERWRTHSKNDF